MSPRRNPKSALAETREARRGEHERAGSLRRRGRPRDTQRHAAILQAARELVLELGYTRVTIDGIAKRSGASRTTLYEWWGHRAVLVQEALFSDHSDWPLPETGSFESDLAALVDELVREMIRPEIVRGLPALWAEIEANPELKQNANAVYAAPMLSRWQQVFEAAAERGEISHEADPRAALHVVIGSLWVMTQSRSLPRERLAPYLLALLLGGIET